MGVYAIRVAESAVGGNAFVREYPEAAAQTYKRGDPVVLDTAGRVKIAVDTGDVFGIADKDAKGTTDTASPIIVIDDSVIFSASVSAAGATANSAQADVGLRCSYIKSTITGETAKTVIDTSDVTNLNIDILDLYDAAATADGRYFFRFVRNKVAAR